MPVCLNLVIMCPECEKGILMPLRAETREVVCTNTECLAIYRLENVTLKEEGHAEVIQDGPKN